MKRVSVYVFALVVLVGGVAFGAGTLQDTAPTVYNYKDGQGRLIRDLKWSWSSTDGTATVTGGYIRGQIGKVLKAWSNVSATNQPDDNYDIRIVKGDTGAGMDVLHDYGQDLPQDFSDSSCEFTPLDGDGNFIGLFGDTLSFKGEYLNTAGTATGDFWLRIEVYDKEY